ncbi:MAG TPA: NHL repeat-containing protein, partial [Pyrinomonadaceae bacterium]|nr:NHL repeat-containing protein [Pyrinomonadaceae bacterium]
MTKDNTKYLILDQVYGWREQVPAEAREGLAFSAEGNRQLFGLPGSSSLLLNESLQEEFVCPSAVSIKSDGRVGVIDAATNRFSLVDIGLPLIEEFSTIGEKGSGSRNFLGPRGVALLKSGGVVVADTANHRVLIFSETQHALVQSWGAIDQTASPAPGNDRKSFRFPWAVAADECGAIFVVDRGNHRIQKISKDGNWLEEIGRDCLVDPIRIALGPRGLIAVVDPPQQAVLIFSPRRTLPRAITNIADVSSVT